jgi:hypothetical protein
MGGWGMTVSSAVAHGRVDRGPRPGGALRTESAPGAQPSDVQRGGGREGGRGRAHRFVWRGGGQRERQADGRLTLSSQGPASRR